jgi:hypothetical protein
VCRFASRPPDEGGRLFSFDPMLRSLYVRQNVFPWRHVIQRDPGDA